MTLQIRRHSGAAGFLARARDWLLEAEAEHNLILGVAERLASAPSGHEPSAYLATVEDARGVVGCAFRTPPYKLGLTRMPLEAVPALVEDVAGVYDTVPIVLGPEDVARAFAERWCERKGTAAPIPGMRQRVYELRQVNWPSARPAGTLRRADRRDLERIVEWITAFNAEAGTALPRAREQAEERIDTGAFFLWEDGEPRTMAAWVGQTPHGKRVGAVYTPPRWRRRGYASAAVAELSQRLLDEGNAYCFLYTDLSNPTSNGIYQRLGYRPVCDVVDYHLELEG